jgi:hypothetical protein
MNRLLISVLLLSLALSPITSYAETESNSGPSEFSTEDQESPRKSLKGFDPYDRHVEMMDRLSPREEPDMARFEAMSTKRLLRMLKKDPFGMGSDEPAQVLAGRGEEASALLLEELETADGYFLACVVSILGRIPSQARDEAFVEKIKELSTPNDAFLRDYYLAPMFWALARDKTPGAAELIRGFAENPQENRGVRADARRALGLLGEPEIVNPSTISVKFEYGDFGPGAEVRIGISGMDEADSYHGVQLNPNSEDGRLASDILYDLIRHELLATDVSIPDEGWFAVKRMIRDGKLLALDGTLPGGKGNWQLIIGEAKNGRVPLYFEWWTGPLAAGGIFGLIEKTADTWVCRYWSAAWIS